jgi:hypothetical protein
MYSYEERIRAVKLYLKLGKRLTATVRQLGYSGPSSHRMTFGLPRHSICCLSVRIIRFRQTETQNGGCPLFNQSTSYQLVASFKPSSNETNFVP